MAWVFQGNPTKFDVDDYVSRYPELIYWRTPRHWKEISVGDRAFVWRSGTDAGAIAVGVVVEAPTSGDQLQHPEALGADLWRIEEPDLSEARTGIRLIEIRLRAEEGMVSREVAKADPDLATATIVSMPIGTVFRLNEVQSAALERLWGLSESPTSPQGTVEGDRKLGSHYRRERSSKLRDKKLAEILSVHGKIFCELCRADENGKYPAPFGQRVFEVHHLAPLSQAATPVRTTLTDLAVLCANCHRAVHATPDVEDNFKKLALHLYPAS